MKLAAHTRSSVRFVLAALWLSAVAGCGNGLDDGCGGILDCGECCEPLSCADLGIACGPATDNCGNAIDCGACPVETTPAPAPVTCTIALGDKCVNDSQCCEGLCRDSQCGVDRGSKICRDDCAA